MGFLMQALAPRFYGAANADDERYWSPVYSTLSRAGFNVTPEAALMCSCLYQGVRLIAETVASLTLRLYRDLGEDELGQPQKELARDNPVWPILRLEPNGWQTPQEFFEVQTARALLWNSAYGEILPGPRGAVDEVIPLDSEAVTVERVAISGPGQPSRYRLRFKVQEPNGTSRTLVQDQVMRLRGFGLHEMVPAPMLRLARESIGLWLALEEFETGFFRQGARPGMVIEHPQRLSKEVYETYREQVAEEHGGVRQMHKPWITQEGGKLSTYGFSLRDAQATESRGFMVSEIARWLNLPEYKLGGTKQPTFASVEQFARDFVDTTILPWTTRWEQTIRRDLIVVDQDTVYAKFILDSLLRGNTLDRAQAYAVFIQNGIFSENEIRAMEDRNPVPGLNQPRRSANQDRGGDPNGARAPKGSTEPTRDEEDEDEESAAAIHRRHMARHHARGVVATEIATVRKFAQKLADKPDAWRDWVTTFYRDHAVLVAGSLQMPPLPVSDYVEAHRRALLSEGVGVLDRWDREAEGELIALALGEVAV